MPAELIDVWRKIDYICLCMSNEPQDITVEEKKLPKDAATNGDDFDFSEFDIPEKDVSDEVLKNMIKAGVWYGRRKNKTHPKMRQYILTNRSGIEIIDLQKTMGLFDSAAEFLTSIIKKSGCILFVGTQPSAKTKIEEIAKKFKEPYVVNRWLGGTLTNFETLKKRVDHFKKLKSDQASGALDKYTKKERSDFNKEIERLSTLFSGVEDMAKLPEAVVLVNAAIHETAIREAKKIKIPVVALVSTNTNPEEINYPVPGNDLSPSSIGWFLEKIEAVLTEAKTSAALPTTPSSLSPENK
ncbi:MAG TPA: 30S ribosomal protein S2 [Candidatus Paceibacterota bacterium]